MNCPACQSNDIHVLESSRTGSLFRRRRECHQCKTRYTTYEIHADEYQSLTSSTKKLEQIYQLIKPALAPVSNNSKASFLRCPCNDCRFVAGFKCSHGYPEYGTPAAIGCLMHESNDDPQI